MQKMQALTIVKHVVPQFESFHFRKCYVNSPCLSFGSDHLIIARKSEILSTLWIEVLS